MKTTMLKHLCSFFAIVVFATAGVANGDTVLSITDSVIVQANGTFPADGIGAPATAAGTTFVLGTTGSLAVRERENTNQAALRVASLIQLDLSGLTAANIADPTFNVTLEADVVGILNSLNGGLDVNVGRNQSGSWSSTAGSEPSFFAGLGGGGVTGASDVSVLIADPQPLSTGLDADLNSIDDGFDSPNLVSTDITAIVVDWFNNGGNDGLVLFGTDNGGGGAAFNASQAAYLDNVVVTASVAVPEPSSLMVLGLGMTSLLLRRRK